MSVEVTSCTLVFEGRVGAGALERLRATRVLFGDSNVAIESKRVRWFKAEEFLVQSPRAFQVRNVLCRKFGVVDGRKKKPTFCRVCGSHLGDRGPMVSQLSVGAVEIGGFLATDFGPDRTFSDRQVLFDCCESCDLEIVVENRGRRTRVFRAHVRGKAVRR